MALAHSDRSWRQSIPRHTARVAKKTPGLRLGVVMSFFSPCGYATPKQLFAKALSRLLATSGITLAVTQAVAAGGSPEPVPAAVAQRSFADAEPLFLKENLWNLAVSLLPSNCDALCFLDADVILTDGWELAVCDTLQTADVCQPFSQCRWLRRNGAVERESISAAMAIEQGRAPWPNKCHPGFGIAMTRDAYNRLGGIYERLPAGGGDMAFWLSMSSHPETDAILRQKSESRELNVLSESFLAYREKALAQNLRIAAPPGVTAIHPWHGDRVNRRYTTRESFFPRRDNGEPAVDRRPDGLLAFTQPAPLAMEYFVQRREDG